MADHLPVPIRVIGADKWGALSWIHDATFEIIGETVWQVADLSFAGQHRVRSYRFRKSVHFRIPDTVKLDISNVQPAGDPKRSQRRHDKRK